MSVRNAPSSRRRETSSAHAASSSRPAGRAPSELTVTSSHRAAAYSNERTGSAFRAVGRGIGGAFSGLGRGVGNALQSPKPSDESVYDESPDLTRGQTDAAEETQKISETAPRTPRRKRASKITKASAVKASANEDANAAALDAEADTDYPAAGEDSAGAPANPFGEGDGDDPSDSAAGTRQSISPDALGLILLALAAIIGASVWFGVAGPIGGAIARAVHVVIGAGALILPVGLFLVALAFMLDWGGNGGRVTPRVAIGTTVIVVAMLGLIHVFAGNPADWAGRESAGGAVGAWTGGLLAAGFSSFVAVPLLILVIVYGALQVTGVTTREAIDYLRDEIAGRRGTCDADTGDADAAGAVDPNDQYGHVADDIDSIAAGRRREDRS